MGYMSFFGAAWQVSWNIFPQCALVFHMNCSRHGVVAGTDGTASYFCSFNSIFNHCRMKFFESLAEVTVSAKPIGKPIWRWTTMFNRVFTRIPFLHSHLCLGPDTTEVLIPNHPASIPAQHPHILILSRRLRSRRCQSFQEVPDFVDLSESHDDGTLFSHQILK